MLPLAGEVGNASEAERSVAVKACNSKDKKHKEPLVASLLLVVMPGAPSSVLAPSSDARSP